MLGFARNSEQRCLAVGTACLALGLQLSQQPLATAFACQLAMGTFNESLSGAALPQALEILRPGPSYNRPLPEWIAPPAAGTPLIGTLFDQSLADAQLPDTLRALIFGASFSQCIDNVRLPPRLEVGTTLLWQQLHRRGLSLAVLSLARQLATSACRRLVLADTWGG